MSRHVRRFLGKTTLFLEGLEPRLLMCNDLPAPPPDDSNDPLPSPPADTQPVDTQPVTTQPADTGDDGGTDDGGDVGGDSGDGGTDTGPVDDTPSAPDAPSRVTLQSPSSTSVFISWSEPDGEADTFTIQRRIPGDRWRKLAKVDGGIEHFTDSTVEPGSVYSYRLFASNDGGDSSTSHAKTIIVTGTTDASLIGTFGKIPGGTRSAPLTFTDTDGTLIKFTLTGPGTGSVRVGATGYDITLDGTTGSSSVKITTRRGGADDGRFTLESLTTTSGQPLRGITATTTDLTGTLILDNAVSSIKLGNLDVGSSLSIGNAAASAAPVSMTFGQVTDADITSTLPIRALSVTNWTTTNADAGNVLTAPSIGALTVKGARGVAGDFAANLSLSSDAIALGTVRIAHQITGGTWTLAGQINSILGGAIRGPWTLSAHDIGSLTLTDRTATSTSVQIDATTIGTLTIKGAADDWRLAATVTRYRGPSSIAPV